jgi:hypothetical protein
MFLSCFLLFFLFSKLLVLLLLLVFSSSLVFSCLALPCHVMSCIVSSCLVVIFLFLSVSCRVVSCRLVPWCRALPYLPLVFINRPPSFCGLLPWNNLNSCMERQDKDKKIHFPGYTALGFSKSARPPIHTQPIGSPLPPPSSPLLPVFSETRLASLSLDVTVLNRMACPSPLP